jgi:hypothetical protein
MLRQCECNQCLRMHSTRFLNSVPGKPHWRHSPLQPLWTQLPRDAHKHVGNHVPHMQSLPLGTTLFVPCSCCDVGKWLSNQVAQDIFQVAGLCNLRATRMMRSIAHEFAHRWLTIAFVDPFWWESASHVLLPHTRHIAASSLTSTRRHIARHLLLSVNDWLTLALIGQRIGVDPGSQPRSRRWRQAAD